MAKVPKKRMKYKQPDILDYEKLSFNPFVQTAETLAKIDAQDYDPCFGPHRARLQKWVQREKDRAELAKRLGVVENVQLTPAEEVLALIPK